MVDVDTTLANCMVFIQWHAHDVKVASAQYRKAMGSHPLLVVTQSNLSHSLSHF